MAKPNPETDITEPAPGEPAPPAADAPPASATVTEGAETTFETVDAAPPASDEVNPSAPPEPSFLEAPVTEAPIAETQVASTPEAPELPHQSKPVRHTHEGVNYLTLLSALHRHYRPVVYLEIGSDKGESLRLATCRSIAIDPKFRITSDVIGEKPALHLFQQTSDEFFASGAARQIAPQGLDLAFLDGMHLFEFLLRDFINTEKLCHWRSAVLLHDCLPPNIEIAERDYRPHLRKDDMWRIHWTGGVWKLIPILQRFRPDLTLTLFDAPPSGLVMITGLDPTNTVLEGAYAQILREYRDFSFDEENYHRFFRELGITSTRALIDGMALSAFL